MWLLWHMLQMTHSGQHQWRTQPLCIFEDQCTCWVVLWSYVFNRRSHCCIPVRAISSSTVDTDEVSRFSHLAAGWWDSTRSGELAVLHNMNQLRVPLIRDAIVRQQSAVLKSPPSVLDSSTPLTGTTILDVGCGGGILSEVLLFSRLCKLQYAISAFVPDCYFGLL